MCLDGDAPEAHRCIIACPVCFILTPENALRLLSGASIELGTVDLFAEVGDMGCRMCQLLSNTWNMNPEIYQPGANVAVKTITQDAPSGQLWVLLFEISQPLDLDFMTSGTGAYRDKKFKSWAVPFGVYSKGSEWLDHFITIKPPNPSVARDDVFEAFKVGLQTCLSDHTECEKPNPDQLPSRLLLLDDNIPDRVFVHECKPGERVSYVALSYCWGKTAQTMLVKANLETFTKKGIEVSTLPKTIQDSIIATRKLGIEYLWIDSLCIIQAGEGSIEDKNKEIVNMARIYKNATITISAAAATDCGQGFLEDRAEVQLRLDKSMCLPFLSTEDVETRQVFAWVYLCPDPHMGHKIRRFSEEPINTRAWTYQESTLSPRLLIFGSGPPQWHCKQRWKILDLNIHPDDLPHQAYSSGVMKITIHNGSIVPEQTLRYFERPDPPKDDIGLWLTWFPLLENYSHRALSYRTDKLLALSALAAEHQSEENGIYAAGLWNASLPRGLLWQRSSSSSEVVSEELQQVHPQNDQPEPSNSLEKKGKIKKLFRRLRGTSSNASQAAPQTSPQKPPQAFNWLRTRLFSTSSSVELPDQYVAPTWSPMSSTDPIIFDSLTTQKEDEFHTSLVSINSIHLSHTNTLNPFGALDFSYLTLTAPMCSMTWQELTANFVIVSQGEPFKYWDFIVPDDPAFFREMSEKYEPSFNPQTLADRNVQHPIDDDDAGIFMNDSNMRVKLPVVQEPASRECVDAETPFSSVPDVKQAVFDALALETHVEGSSSGKHRAAIVENDECEFWLLEVERSMSPAGLVLKRVDRDVFARVGYFGMNSCLDPEIVYLPGRVQVRGNKYWRWGDPDGKNNWNKGLAKRKIHLV